MRFDPKIAASDIRELAPKLVVLGYGSNEGSLDDLDLAGYEQEWTRLIKLVRSGAPEAALLMLGPPDAERLPPFAKGEARDAAPCRPLTSQELANYGALIGHEDQSLARWHEPPSLVAIRARLARIAGRFGAVYWDLSRFMGGHCSMDRWAKADPPLALPDHIHLTDEGSRRVGQAIYDAPMAGYDRYLHEAPAIVSGGR
jgi:lysophospholipase L1-like esterase